MGRDIKNFNIDVWNESKYQIVVKGNYLKFSQNENKVFEIKLKKLIV